MHQDIQVYHKALAKNDKDIVWYSLQRSFGRYQKRKVKYGIGTRCGSWRGIQLLGIAN